MKITGNGVVHHFINVSLEIERVMGWEGGRLGLQISWMGWGHSINAHNMGKG